MINYIILIHKNPAQVKRLIKALMAENNNFYIHLDKSIDIGPFKEVLNEIPHLYFLNNNQRQYGTWGDIGIVKATIAALKQIVEDKRTGYCVLLSGQDYPIRNVDNINLFFEKNYGTNYLYCNPMPTKDWLPYGGMERLNEYKINRSSERGDFIMMPSVFDKEFYTKTVFENIKALLRMDKRSFVFKLFKKRKHPHYLKPYGGSQWWALPMETIKFILDFMNDHPGYLSYHTNTLLPDEILIQSIVMLLHEHENAKIGQSITYIDWKRPNVPLPVTFTSADFNELLEISDKFLFARKFDIETDEKILNLIDEKILNG